MSEPNLVPYLNRLTVKEKAVLLRLVRQLPDQEHHFEGTLPFVALKTAVGILELIARGGYASDQWKIYARISKDILRKIDQARHEQDVVVFFMRLDAKKVYRQFGRSPERGKPLNHLPKMKVTVGVKYSLPYKDYLPDKDVLVAPSVSLRKPWVDDMWEVTVLAQCRARVGGLVATELCVKGPRGVAG